MILVSFMFSICNEPDCLSNPHRSVLQRLRAFESNHFRAFGQGQTKRFLNNAAHWVNANTRQKTWPAHTYTNTCTPHMAQNMASKIGWKHHGHLISHHLPSRLPPHGTLVDVRQEMVTVAKKDKYANHSESKTMRNVEKCWEMLGNVGKCMKCERRKTENFCINVGKAAQETLFDFICCMFTKLFVT